MHYSDHLFILDFDRYCCEQTFLSLTILSLDLLVSITLLKLSSVAINLYHFRVLIPNYTKTVVICTSALYLCVCCLNWPLSIQCQPQIYFYQLSDLTTFTISTAHNKAIGSKDHITWTHRSYQWRMISSNYCPFSSI